MSPQVIAMTFLVLLSVVALHEFGHLLAARIFNVDIEEFAIGFGPKLVAFNVRGLWISFRLIPLGGFLACADEEHRWYCKMCDTLLIRGGQTCVSCGHVLPRRVPMLFTSISRWRKVIIASGGVAMNVVSAFVVGTAALSLFPLEIFKQMDLSILGKVGCLSCTPDVPMPLLIAMSISGKIIAVFAITAAVFPLYLLANLPEMLMLSIQAGNVGGILEMGRRTSHMGTGIVFIAAWFCNLFHALSVTLGLLNLLPFKPLDGGHVFEHIVLEGMPESKARMWLQNALTIAGSLLIAGLMLAGILGDILLVMKKVL